MSASEESVPVARLVPWLVFAVLVLAGLYAYARFPQAVAPLLSATGAR